MAYTPPVGSAVELDLYVVIGDPNAGTSLYFAAGMEDMLDSVGASSILSSGMLLSLLQPVSAQDAYLRGHTSVLSASAASTDAVDSSVFTFWLERIAANDALAPTSNTTSSLTDSAIIQDTLRAAFNQLVAESATGTDAWFVQTGVQIIDAVLATQTLSSTMIAVKSLAETIVMLDAFNGAESADITDSAAFAETYMPRVQAVVAILESALAVDENVALVHVMQLATDTASSSETLSSAGSVINALLSDVTLATIRLNIGGELFTGWVLNTDTLAPSEYQFADRQFNSACKHGSKYLMAAEDGIYEFTDDTGVETVMTYIKTGKTDFGSDMRKRVEGSYMVYSATGNMALRVITSENGALQTNTYTMMPFASSETQDAQRSIIGKGIKSRYWQFELTGANAGCEFDEIGMLPVVLSRRI